MKLKLITAAVSATVLFFSCMLQEKKNEAMDEINDDMMKTSYILESGTISAGSGSGSQLRITGTKIHDELILNITEAVPVIDLMTGTCAEKAVLTTGVSLYAWVLSAYTASLPPQTAAQVLFINVREQQKLPVLIKIAEIASTDSGIVITAESGSKWIFNRDSEIGICSGTAIDNSDASTLKKGVKVLLWKSGTMMKERITKVHKMLVIA